MPRELHLFEPPELELQATIELADRTRVREATRAKISELDGQRLAALAAYYPNLSPGVVTGAALAGLEPTDPAMTSLALDQTQRELEVWQSQRSESEEEGILGKLGRWTKGAIRGAFLGFDWLWEEGIQRPVRALVQQSRGTPWAEAYEQAGPSMLGLALREREAGREVNVGSGFFPGGDLAAETQRLLESGVDYDTAIDNDEQRQLGVPIAQTQRQLRERIKITSAGGQQVNVTPGRLAAIQFLEPNTLPFNMVSGGLDFAANIFADPSNLALGGIGKARKAAQALQPASTALVRGGPRAGFLSRTWDEYLQTGNAQNMMRWMADEKDFGTLWGFFRGSQTPAAGLAKTVKNIVDADDVDTVLGVLKSAGNDAVLAPRTLTPTTLTGRALGYEGSLISRGLGGAIGGKVGAQGGFKVGLRHRLDGTWFGKMGAQVGARSLNVYDIDQSIDDFGAWLRVAGFGQDRMSHYLGELAQTSTIGPDGLYQTSVDQAFRVVRDAIGEWGDELKKAGLPAPVVKGVTRMFDSHEQFKAYWLTADKRSTWFPGAKVQMMDNGQLRTLPSAQLFSEFLDRAIPLIDVRQVRKAAHQANVERFRDASGWSLGKKIEDWDEIGPGIMERLMDNYMQRIWKPSVLLRVAWPVRVIGEEQIRMAASGLDSMFSHPLQWLAWTVAGKKGSTDVLGSAFEASMQYRGAMSRKAGAMGFIGERNSRRAALKTERILQTRGDTRHVEGAWHQINMLATDELAPHVARAGLNRTLSDVKESFMNGDLQHLRFRLMRDGDRWGVLNNRADADGYIDSVWARINQATGGDFRYYQAHPDAWRAGIEKQINPATGKTYTPEEITAMREHTGQWFDAYGNKVDPVMPDGTPYPQPAPLDTGTGRPLTQDQLRARAAFDEVNARAKAAAEESDVVEGGAELFVDLDEALDDLGREVFGPTLGADLEDEVSAFFREFTEDLYDHALNGTAADATIEGFLNNLRRLAPDLPPDRAAAMDDAANAVVAALDSAPLKEFIPYIEAMKLSKLQPGEFAQTFWNHEVISRFTPVRTTMPDGVHRIPLGGDVPGIVPPGVKARDLHRQIAVVAVHDGYKHAELRLLYKADGTFDGVAVIRHSGDRAAPSTQAMMRAAQEAGEITGSELISKIMRGADGQPIEFDRWLKYAATRAGMDVSGVNSLEDVAELIRKNPEAFENMRPFVPGDTETLTQQGAKFTGNQIARAADNRTGTGLDVEQWPQHRPQYQIHADGNQELITAIAEGNLRGTDMLAADTNRKVKDLMRVLGDDFADSLPQYTHVAARPDKTITGQWDEAVDRMFGLLMSEPTNRLSRSPAFKQYYWQRVAQIFPYATNEVKEQILHAARDAGLGRGTLRNWLKDLLGGEVEGTLRRLDEMAGPGFKLGKVIREPVEGISDIAHIDEIAKAAALHETKGLLYDLSRKHNFFDMTRNIFPFGEAWWEIISTWSRIISENPQIARRLQQGVAGARNSGFFYDDPTTGEEVFNFPGSQAISRWMFGGEDDETGNVTAQFTGRVQGVNLMLGSYMPGVGPLVQIPVSNMGWFDNPDHKWARDMLLPFGAEKVEDLGDAIETMIAPTWWEKFMVAIGKPSGDMQRLYNNTVIDVYKALLMEGGNDQTPQQASLLLDRAKDLAKTIYRFRAASQFVGPTGASVRFDARDKNGEVWAFQSLATSYAEILEANDFNHEAAFGIFTSTYGLDPSSLYTAKTRSIFKRSTTEAGADFEARNPELFAQLPLTAYYARPDDPNEEFDYQAYLRQLEEGTREALSPEEWTMERNDFLGRIAYERARRVYDRIPGETSSIALRNYRTELADRFPGYDIKVPGLDARPDRDQLINEFYKWREVPGLAATPSGQGLLAYLQFRDMVITEGIRLGLTPTGFRSAKRTKYLRDWLRTVANSVVQMYPEFGPMWEQVFEREIEEAEPDMTLMGVDFGG